MPISKNIKGIKNPFLRTRNMAQQEREAIRVMNVVLAIDDIDDKMKAKILDQMIWNYTGAVEGSNGKYLLKYRSLEAIYNENADLIHEHVFQRKNLIKSILKEKIVSDETISKMVGCVVTKEEHERLKEVEQTIDGWERYKKANIKVMDMEKNSLLEFPTKK